MKRLGICIGLLFLFLGVPGVGEDLCTRVDMKPVLSLEQVRMAELVDFLCELSGIKNLPSFPKDISGMTPEEFYKLEVKMLIDNGFPPIFEEIEPDRLVNRRFFASLMFQIAMQVDERVQEDCKDAVSETEQMECLIKHDWIYSETGKIYREEILTILCEQRKQLEEVVPPPEIKPPEIYPEKFQEGVLEAPATPSE